MVFVQQQFAVDENRRAGRTELVLERPERFFPDQFPSEVVAYEAEAAEEAKHAADFAAHEETEKELETEEAPKE